MSSKVFSAHVYSLTFGYKFLDETSAEFSFRAPTTAEIDEAIAGSDGGEADVGSGAARPDAWQRNKSALKNRFGGDKKLLEKFFAEYETNGNLYELAEELQTLLGEAKAAKKRG